MEYKTIETTVLRVAYYEYGPQDGWAVILSHGFPYDIHAYDEVVPILEKSGARVIVPYLRGFGPTRFLSSATVTMRSGQQAALGSDLISLLDALGIDKAVLAGFDWGGLASCVAAVLWPERVAGLVSYAGYDVYNRVINRSPNDPELECVQWYQHLFQSERGRECLSQHRHKLCKMLWRQWSPTWNFSDREYDQTATSFDNPDFVDIVVHTYRHAHGTANGDPALQDLEEKLAARPKILMPAVTLDGTRDPLKPGGTAAHGEMFQGRHEHFVYDVGHAFPLEAPEAFAEAILLVHKWISHGSSSSK
ncbi:alpha/beta-hydrolase [Periconia macrospinosa]|uniref:Alpha/beta-hydrolase n=1 Tax=Periconia macrospinosa TaxID=97972 RepID=A0A2V1DL65_9PLEO|nr:alpha/beta-hydrolase [Periconia macrospinosa]